MKVPHGIIIYGIMGLLLLLNIIILAVAVERCLIYRATRIESISAVVIRADRDIPLQSFVDIYEMIKHLGVLKLSLQTGQEK